MSIVLITLVALAIIVYLAIGVCIALWFFRDDLGAADRGTGKAETRWWQIVAVVLLWPLIPVGLIFMVVAWMASGSH